MQLIDKDKVDEILRNLWKEDDGHNPEHRICYNKALQEVQCEIDTLEVKEVDLKKNINSWYYFLNIPENYNIPQTVTVIDIVEKTAKHFFELGLKAAQKGE